MDGLHLTSKVKNDPQLQHIPVVLFSSLITPDNIKKCEGVAYLQENNAASWVWRTKAAVKS